jgi:pimeloyl-ACP methyl ester carboxylesterase
MERAMTDYARFAAPVDGGELAGGTWRPDAAGVPVLAVHGITASHLSWPFLVDELPGVRIIAPDLRGRARSNRLPGPFGLTQHADDLARLLDHVGVERAVLVGHSMGAFVSVLAAARHADRVASLVLVDGGLPIPAPADVSPEDVPALVLGPALSRLSMEFADVESYLQFWRAHPALGPHWTKEIEAYAEYDLDGVAPHLRSSSNPEAIAENELQLDGANGYAAALAALRLPIDFIRAPRGLLDGAPLYSPEDVERETAALADVALHEAVDVNHYTIVMSSEGAAQVAPLVTAQLDRAAQPVGEETR